jgi:hypothetical protein
MPEELNEFAELCKPLVEYLTKRNVPYESIVVTQEKAELLEVKMGIPVNRPGSAEDKKMSISEMTSDGILRQQLELLAEWSTKCDDMHGLNELTQAMVSIYRATGVGF